MRTKTVEHDDPGNPLSVTVREADVLTGMRHTTLITTTIEDFMPKPAEGEEPEEKPEGAEAPEDRVLTGEEFNRFLVRRHVWPHCRAAAISAEGFDLDTLTFDQFCRMPERFVAKWESAALELNPHWKELAAGDEKAQEEEKKKEPESKEE